MKLFLPEKTEVLILNTKKQEKKDGVYVNAFLKKYNIKKDLEFDFNDIKEPKEFLEKSKKFFDTVTFKNEKGNKDILYTNSYVRLEYQDYIIFVIDTKLKYENNISYCKIKVTDYNLSL